MERRLERLEAALRQGLALLEGGRAWEARDVLAEALAEPVAATADAGGAAPRKAPLAAELRDDELEHAFAEAETNPEEMLDATAVVRATLEREGLGDFEADDAAAPDAGFAPDTGSPFATGTMAQLLERQGHAEGARVIRDALGGSRAGGSGTAVASRAPGGMDAAEAEAATRPRASAGGDEARRSRILATLETWLANVRRGVA